MIENTILIHHLVKAGSYQLYLGPCEFSGALDVYFGGPAYPNAI